MTDPLVPRVEAALTAALGQVVTLEGRTPLAGGSINRTEHIETTAGPFVLKSHAAAPAGLFAAEAAGLDALRTSGTSLRIPRVVALDDPPEAPAGRPLRFLVLEYLAPAARCATFDDELGSGLAELHRPCGTRFGFVRDTYCGTTPQPNPWTDRWVAFYRDHRLGYQVALAVRTGVLPAGRAGTFDRLLANLDTWIDEPADGASLVHGDLWSGNLHTAPDGGPALLDPAAYVAHREAEFGMMLWFGGCRARVYDAYLAAYPLEPGWRDRHWLYRLYHVLNHANLFGGGYVDEAIAIARRFAG